MALAPVGEDVGIPAHFKVTASVPDLLIVTPTKVVNAVTITATDTFYGVPFQFTIPEAEWLADGPQYEGGIRANGIEAMAAHPHVVGLDYTQDVNRAGALVDAMVVTVGTDDGQYSAEFTWPLLTLNSVAAFTKADQVFAAIQRDMSL